MSGTNFNWIKKSLLFSKIRKYGSSTIAAEGFPPAKLHLIPSSGLYPLGFTAGAAHCGIKKKAGVPDLVLVKSDIPCIAAGVFTTNSFAAAPVVVSKKVLQEQDSIPITGVIINSGCANACTGDQGLKDAISMSELAASALGNINSSTLVMSTGVIGQPLKMEKLISGIANLSKDLKGGHAGWMEAAVGIMTTDTYPKLRSQEFTTKSGKYRMAGWCKGAGMIHPNMATMLSGIFTDLNVTKECLDKALKFAVSRSFNAISIDGDTSTNDTLVILSNGAAKDAGIISDPKSAEYFEFEKNLTEFSTELAKLIVRDGEGATKFVDVQVKGARSFEEAMTIASTISTSPLVKTAIYGRDANWGRIICAVGYSGIKIQPEKVNLHLHNTSGDTKHSLHLFKDGAPYDVNEEIAAKILKEDDIVICVNLGLGDAEANMYTCDFSHEYVTINGDYRS